MLREFDQVAQFLPRPRELHAITARDAKHSAQRLRGRVVVVPDLAEAIDVAAELGEALGNATVEILPPGGLMWSHRTRVRSLVADFLNA